MAEDAAASAYGGLDAATRSALMLGPDEVVAAAPAPLEVFDDNEAMIAAFAGYLETDYGRALASGRERVLIIAPVGPIGQYDRLADACLRSDLALDRLTILIMDEYLTVNGDWIGADDPLSFRRHVNDALIRKLPAEKRPELVVPDPHDLGAVARTIEAHGGVDVAYAGVGITGHLAFNDPLPGQTDPDWFARIRTRVVSLSPETRLINSVTAARGNVDRIPHSAVTVGMAEILGARRLRIFMNREWQCAAIRRLLFGPVTAAFPASLARAHAALSLHVVRHVLDRPEPGLR